MYSISEVIEIIEFKFALFSSWAKGMKNLTIHQRKLESHRIANFISNLTCWAPAASMNGDSTQLS